MRAWIVLVVLLAGCSDATQPHSEESGSEGQPEAPPVAVEQENATPPVYHNGTIQNAGQCLVWRQDEIGGVTWHDLEGTQGIAYEATFQAAVGPPPAVVGATGACIAFDTPSGPQHMAPRGTVPEGATRVAALTDAMVDGTYSIRIDYSISTPS